MNQFNNINLKNKEIKIFMLIKKIALLIVTVIIGLTIVLNVHTIQEDEIVFVRTFGKIIRVIDKPGLYFKIPIINTTSTISKKILYYESQPSKILTKDNKNIFVEVFILWRIKEPKLFIDTLQSISNTEIRIDNSVNSLLKLKLITEDYNNIINNNDSLIKDIADYVRDELKLYGIDIIEIKLKNLYLSEESKDSIYARIRSEREKISAQYLSIGEKEASRIRSEADKEVKIILSKAQTEAEKLKGAADAEAAQIYANSYNKDPEFYRFMRTLESYKKTLINNPTIIIPIDSPFAKYLIGK
ncbi:protease modulator HflC [Lutispora sp.]|uniref:protease modulator HflC n=1 Tax=Lutispora sp. TaxID=2828727 RepID=UPI00356A56EA